ncbi:MAG: C_GCAxxG_C_C family protein [Deltaproteobacteria bacterium]|nr:C_GCAxxG_C_C family protein [Deltaproteobacteria bacterium]
MADDADSKEQIARLRELAHRLYAGEKTPHRSCGICLAEAFGRAPAPYQALRRGGITGRGQCGAIKAGELILGELFGDPDPCGPVTERLRQAMVAYQARCAALLQRAGHASDICNDLTASFADFHGAARHRFCTELAADVAEILAEVITTHGGELPDAPR